MNLPKHIEERFEKEFGREDNKIPGNIPILRTGISIKDALSFIAQILEEEKERLVGEIEQVAKDTAHLDNCQDCIDIIIDRLNK